MKELFLFGIIISCLSALWFTRNDPSFAVSKLDYMNRVCSGTFNVTKDGFSCDGRLYKWRK